MSTGIGEALREARERQGRSVEEAAHATRMREDYVVALEAEDFGIFGGDVYAKSFLSTYARYLKVDPQPLLERYRRHVQDESRTAALTAGAATRQPRNPPPRWLAWGGAVAVVLVGAIALANVVGGAAPEPAEEPSELAQPTPTPTPTEPTPTPSPTPSPTPTPEGVDLTVVFEGRSWIRVTIDDEVVQEETVEAGQQLEFSDDEAVTIRFGAPGAVSVQLNGEELGAPGEPGQPVTVTFTPDGIQQA